MIAVVASFSVGKKKIMLMKAEIVLSHLNRKLPILEKKMLLVILEIKGLSSVEHLNPTWIIRLVNISLLLELSKNPLIKKDVEWICRRSVIQN